MAKKIGIISVAIFFFLILTAVDFMASMAEAIPLFARNYKLSCTTCHIGFPKLNSFGEAFAGNGYRFSEGDLSDQNVETGDDKVQPFKSSSSGDSCGFVFQGPQRFEYKNGF
jgi:hypothetical protein